MAATAETKGGGKANVIVSAAALTVLALIGGGLVGKMIVARLKDAIAPVTAQAAAKPLPYPSTVEVRELPPVITNLAPPTSSHVRMQVAIVYDKGAIQEPGVVAAQINDDIIGFLNTLTLVKLQGASGLQNLREDLDDRAAVRTQGKVREVVIETLVVD